MREADTTSHSNMSRACFASLGLKLASATIALSATLLPFSLLHASDGNDVATVKSCISAEKDAHSCIGRVSDACQKQLKDETTQNVVDCVNREQTAWDAIMNERYKTEVTAAKAADEDLKTMPDGKWEPVLDDLKKAQRAWVAFRDAECARRYALYQTGTYRFDAEAACQLDLTAERALGLPASQP